MITRKDCLLLLANIDTEESERLSLQLLKSKDNSVLVDAVKYINENRQLDLSIFYENLRHNYNKKRSKLYKNIVKEITDTNEVLTTLSALLTQILLYSKKCEDKELFLKHSRATEICQMLQMYFTDYDISSCIKLLRLIKIDLKILEESKSDFVETELHNK